MTALASAPRSHVPLRALALPGQRSTLEERQPGGALLRRRLPDGSPRATVFTRLHLFLPRPGDGGALGSRSAVRGGSDAAAARAGAAVLVSVCGLRRWGPRASRQRRRRWVLRAEYDVDDPVPPSLDGRDPEPTAPTLAIWEKGEKPGRNSLVLQHRLLSEPQHQAVLAQVDLNLPKFDIVNMSTAMGILSRVAREDALLKRQITSDARFLRLYRGMKAKLLASLGNGEVAPRTISSVAFSCSYFNVFEDTLFDAIVNDATANMEKYNTSSISSIVLGLGVMQRKPKAQFSQTLVRQVRSRIDLDFTPEDIGRVLLGFQKLELRDQRLLRIVTEHVKKTQLKDWEASELGTLCFAYAKLECVEPQVFSIACRRMIEILPTSESRVRLEPSILSTFAMSLAYASTAGLDIEDMHKLLALLDDAAMLQGNSLDQRTISTYLFSIGKFRMATTDFSVWDAITFTDKMKLAPEDPRVNPWLELLRSRGLNTFTMSELNLINYTMMRLNCKQLGFFARTAGLFQKRAAELQGLEIINVLYTYSKKEYLPLHCCLTLVEEVKRRQLVEKFEALQMATLVYSMGQLRISDQFVLDTVAARVCREVRQLTSQEIVMTMWGLAVTNGTRYAKEVSSCVMEEVASRLQDFTTQQTSLLIWCAAMLSGASSSVWILKIIFHSGFWKSSFTVECLTMVYYALAALKVELGLSMEDTTGWPACQGCYIKTTDPTGRLMLRVSQGLIGRRVLHKVNSFVDTREGFPVHPQLRADIMVEGEIILEIEGPQKYVVPLEQVSKRSQSDGLLLDIAGLRNEAMEEIKYWVDCNLTGSGSFKQRLFQRCGWRVLTFSFEEDDSVILESLGERFSRPEPEEPPALGTGDPESAEEAEAQERSSEEQPEPQGADAPQEEGEEEEEEQPEPQGADAPQEEGEEEEEAEEAEAADEEPPSLEDLASPDMELQAEPFATDVLFLDDGSASEELSDYEAKLRRAHAGALQELARRLEEARGDAVAGSKFADHMEYRQWQVQLEMELLQQMSSAM